MHALLSPLLSSICLSLGPMYECVLPDGDLQETGKMLKFCQNELKGRKTICHAPSALETVNVSPLFPSLQIQLSNTLLPNLHFREIAGSSFCWVNGTVAPMVE
eukprot:scaffold59155_cov34-Prasinocladus_malaysianus.AAC.1